MKTRDRARLFWGTVGVIVGLSMVALPALAGSDNASPRAAKGQGKVSASGGTEASTLPDSSANQPAPAGTTTGDPVHGCAQADAGYEHNYASTCDGRPSQNGVGDGEATGQPCMGCVGAADNKNPKGQRPDGVTDGNQGYECDGNQGIGKGNPAHTTCEPVTVQTPPPPPPTPSPTPTPPDEVLPTPPITPSPTPTEDEVLPRPPLTPPPPPDGPPVEERDQVLGRVLPVTGPNAMLIQLLGLAFTMMGGGTLLRHAPRRK